MSQLIHLRLEDATHKEIKEVSKKHYATQSEFIKEAIRMHLAELRKQEAYDVIATLKGSIKGKYVTKKERIKAVDVYLNSKRNIFKEYGLE